MYHLKKYMFKTLHLKQELPEDNEARRVEGVWGKGQGHRGQNVDMHGKDLSLGICVIYINGVTKWYVSNDQFWKPKRKF